MRWLVFVSLLAGCSKLFGIEKIPYAGDAAPPDSPPDAPLVAKLQLGSSTFDFGSIVMGKSSFAIAIEVTNVGDASTGPLAFTKSGAAADDFVLADSAGCTGKSLEPGAGCTFSIKFTPSTSGSCMAMLDISDSIVSADAAFGGVGLVPGALDMSPSPADFGMHGVGTTDGTLPIVLKNTGQAPLALVSVSLTGDSGAFAFTPGSGCSVGDSLAGGATCSITATFTPGLGGTHVASLQVTTDAETASQSSAALGGTATSTATVTRHGNGTGSVGSSDNSIDCGGTCTATFAAPAINLRGTANPLNAMTSWSSNCQASGTNCTLPTTAATLAIDATFTAYPTISVSVTGTPGAVIGPNGLDCTNTGGTCSVRVPPSSFVMLVPQESGDSVFSAWSGDCAGMSGACNLTANADKTAVAAFQMSTDYVVNVIPTPTDVPSAFGARIFGGTSPCLNGDTCSYHYASPAEVDLTATNDKCAMFNAFSGDCLVLSDGCDIVMSADQHVYTVTYEYISTDNPICPQQSKPN